MRNLFLFPRTIMTKKLGYQKIVYSKEEVIEIFSDSNFVDCRINAYPYLTEYKDIPRYKPEFHCLSISIKIILKLIEVLNLHYTTL